jgi:hypothetical protein
MVRIYLGLLHVFGTGLKVPVFSCKRCRAIEQIPVGQR